jgi:hypothetical protein
MILRKREDTGNGKGEHYGEFAVEEVMDVQY